MMSQSISNDDVKTNKVRCLLSELVGKYDVANINRELPIKEQLIADAYSSSGEEALNKKADITFQAQNESVAAATRLQDSLMHRIEVLCEPHLLKLTKKMLGLDQYHERLIPRSRQKKTVFDKVVFSIVALVAVSTPLIAWFAMSQYLTSSGIFPDFYEYWWKPMLFSVLGVTTAFLLKQYEDRLLTNDDAKRKFVKVITWVSLITISVWILLFATLFSFADTALLEGTYYEPYAVWGFTVLQLFSELMAGAIVWSYSAYLNNKNKEFETSENAIFKTAEQLEDYYAADKLTLEAHLDCLTRFLEAYQNFKSIFTDDYMAQIGLIRGRIALKQAHATFQYVDAEIVSKNANVSSSLRLI